MTVQLGAINTDLTLSDNYSEVLARIDRNTQKMVENLTKSSVKAVNENAKLKASYDKIAASLDPAIARSQKYDKTVDVLKKSLASGAISQDDFNKKLALAEQKYNGNQRITKVLEAETRKLEKSYERLAHSLDPVNRKTDQYEENLDTLNRALKANIIGQDTYNKRLTQLSKTLDDSNQRINRLGQNLTEVGSNITRLSLPLAAVGGFALKTSIDFESSFAGVRKTLDATDQELNQMAQSIRDMAAGPKAIPVDVNDLNAIAEAAGQLGIAKEDVLKFTETIAALGEASNLSYEEGATSLAQFQNIFGAAGKDVDRLASTIVALGNKGASTEKQIVEMGLRIAGAGKQIGLTQGEVLGIASALSSVGIEAEAGGSAISTLMINMRLAVSKGGDELHNFNEVAKTALPAGKDFATVFGEDAATGVQAFIKGLVNIEDSGGDVIRVLDDMGISGIRIRDATTRAAGAGDLLENSLKLQKTAWEENNALTEEARKRYATTESQLKIMWQRLKDVAITLGNSLVPSLILMLEALEPVMKLLAHFAELFGRLPGPIKLVVAGIGGLTLALGPALFITGQMMQMWATFVTIAPAVAGHFAAIRLSVLGMTAVIAGVLLGLDQIITKWKEAMSAAIEYDITTSKIEGRSLRFVQSSKQGPVSGESHQQAVKDLLELQDRLRGLRAEYDKLNEISKKGGYMTPAESKRMKEALSEHNALAGTYNRLGKAVKEATIEQKKVPGVVAPIIPVLKGVKKEVDEAAKAWEDLLKVAREAVEASREELANAVVMLASRRIGIDAVKLQTAVIDALKKATAAGTAATSEQRLEIIRNTLATFQLRTAYENLEEQQRQTVDLFKANREELEKEVKVLGELLDLLTQISDTAIQNSISLNVDQVNSGGQQATDFTRARIDYAKEWRESWKTASQVANEEIERVMDSLLTVEEKQRAIANIRLQQLDEELSGIYTYASGWQQFFNQIGSMFGGFAQSVSTALSNMISTAQAFQSAGSAIGGQAGGYISAAGPFFAVAGALVGAIQADNARIAQRQYTSSVDLGFGTGQMGVMGRQGRALANSLQAALDPILDVLASTLADLPNITILAREDGKGFKVQVYDTILGIFDTMEEAMDAAVLAAVDFLTRTEGLTATMRQVLENTQAQTSEDLMHDLDFGQWYDNLGLGTAGQAIRDAFSEMRRGIDDALRLGLGADKIKTWFEQQRREIIGGMLGVDFSAAQALRNLQGAAQALEDLGGAERARLQEILESQERELAEIVASGPRRNEETGRLESQEMWQREIDRLRAAITQYTAQLGEIPEALSDQEMALGVWSVFEKYLEGIGKYSAMGIKFAQMRVDLEFEETRLALVQMGLWEEWAQTFNDAYAAARREAGKPRGGRGGGAGDSVRDFIDDRRFQLSLDGMSEYRRQLAEIERQYREIGKPTAELIALRNQEIDQLNRLRNQEVASNFQEFMGLVSPFDQIRKTAADLIADIKDSPFGDARKAAMIGRVMGEVDRQIHRMSQEMARGLFGEMLGDLERFGLEEGLQLQLRQSMAIIEHTLKMVHYQEEIEILRAKGKLTTEQMRLLDESLAVLRNINPLTIAGGVSGRQPLTPTGQELRDALTQRQADEANQLADALKRARESLNRYQDDGLDPLTKDLREIFKNFAEIKLYMGATPEVVETFNKAVKNAVDRFLDPIRESRRDLFFSESSAVDPMTQWAQLQLERDSLIARFRAGDLSVVDEIAGFGSELMDLAGDVIPMGSRAYEQIQNDWDRFLSEVQISVPGMVDVDSAPMQVVGMNDLTAIGEAQVDRLDMLYASQVRTNEHLQNLNMKVGYSGGLDSVN